MLNYYTNGRIWERFRFFKCKGISPITYLQEDILNLKYIFFYNFDDWDVLISIKKNVDLAN